MSLSPFVSVFEQLQAVAVGIISADALFNGQSSQNGQPFPVITELKQDIGQELQLALGEIGTCILVLTPVFEFFDEEIFDYNGWALLSITVFENVVINQGPTGTLVRSIKAAERILTILHGTPTQLFYTDIVPIGTPNMGTCFVGLKRPIELTNEGPPVQYTINFKAHVSLNRTIP